MTMLDAKFVANARKKPFEFEHGIHVVWFSASDETAGEGAEEATAELEVTLNDEIIGYITEFSDEEHGAVAIDDFGKVVPTVFRTLEGALEQMMPGAADGLDARPVL